LNSLTYIDASEEDSQVLTDIAIRSKKYWGYTDEQIHSWLPELEIPVDFIAKHKLVKVLNDTSLIGFFALCKLDEETITLEHMWLEPGFIQKGLGKQIFSEILRCVRSEKYKTLTATADPNANGFYEKMGGRVSNQVQSSIPGRILSTYTFLL
jgi:GNAT superfamily N-acetyltransferase